MTSPGLLFALGWLCLASSVSYLLSSALGQPFWSTRTLFLLPTTLTVLAAPGVARRIAGWAGNRRVHLSSAHAMVAASLATVEVTLLVGSGVLRTPPIAPSVVVSLAMRSVAAYALVAFATLAIDGAQRRREAAAERAIAAAELARASLDAACWRLQPDILLPALLRIEAALDGDPDEAADRVARLGGLLRLLLRDTGDESTVAEEASLLGATAEVALGPGALRLAVSPAASLRRLPRLLLVGVASPLFAAGRGTLRVSVEEHDGRLRVAIDTDGAAPLDRALAQARLQARWPGRLEVAAAARSLHLTFPATAPT